MLKGGQSQDRIELALERSEIGQPSAPHKVDVVDIGSGQACDLDQPGSIILLASVLDEDILDSFILILLVIDFGLGHRQCFTVSHAVVGLERSGVLSLRHEENPTQERRTSNAGILRSLSSDWVTIGPSMATYDIIKIPPTNSADHVGHEHSPNKTKETVDSARVGQACSTLMKEEGLGDHEGHQ